MNGADAVASILKQEGVEYLFCYPSNPLIEACAKIGIRPVLARTERTVVNMADGYTRISNRRKLAVCAVQHSPGSENSFGGIAQAYADSVPILFLPGGVEREEAIIAPNFDATFNYKNITKWANRIPTPERIPAMMRRAISQVRNGRPGPVLLEVPIDISQGDFDESHLSYQPIVTTRLAPDPDVVEGAAPGDTLRRQRADLRRPGRHVRRSDRRAPAASRAAPGAGRLDDAGQGSLSGRSSSLLRGRRQVLLRHGRSFPPQGRPRPWSWL